MAESWQTLGQRIVAAARLAVVLDAQSGFLSIGRRESQGWDGGGSADAEALITDDTLPGSDDCLGRSSPAGGLAE